MCQLRQVLSLLITLESHIETIGPEITVCFFGSVAITTLHSLNAFALSLLLLLRVTFGT